MAEVARNFVLYNPPDSGPARKKKRVLSAAQRAALAKGQRMLAAKRAAAARAAGSRAQATRPKHRHRPAKSNPGGVVEVLLNPAQIQKGVTQVATKKKKSSHKHSAASGTKHRSNPSKKSHGKKHSYKAVSKRKYRGNPGGASALPSLVTSAAYAIAGAVGSKVLTQAVLGTSNTGFVGYGANLVAAFAIGKGVGMFLKNRNAENALILGGVIQTLLRVIVDNTSLGKQLSLNGMGDYLAQDFLTPQRLVPVIAWRQSARIADPRQAAAPAQIAPMQKGSLQSIGRSMVMPAAA